VVHQLDDRHVVQNGRLKALLTLRLVHRRQAHGVPQRNRSIDRFSDAGRQFHHPIQVADYVDQFKIVGARLAEPERLVVLAAIGEDGPFRKERATALRKWGYAQGQIHRFLVVPTHARQQAAAALQALRIRKQQVFGDEAPDFHLWLTDK
jgi:hypothetical protein